MPSVQIQHAHAHQKLSEKTVPTTLAWAIYGHVAYCPLAPSPSGRRIRRGGLRAGDHYAQERIGVQWRTASGVWFIVPSVFQKTVKTVKNRE